MPSWKKVVVSGSNAILNDITSSGNINNSAGTGSFGRIEATVVSASRVDVDASTITIGGTEIDKTIADNIQNTSGTNTGDVTLSGTPDYITISNQVITRNTIDISDDTNLVAGTNITLVGDTLNVDDAFLVNNANDSTTGTITAGGFTTNGTLTLSGLSAQNSELTALMINGSNHVGTRELGALAFEDQADLTSDVTGTLPVANGGTGVTSMTNLKNALDDETWTFANKLTADAGIDIDNINIDGTTISLSSGDLTLDAAGDIVLDADGTDILLKDDGTAFGRFKRDSSDFIIKSEGNNNDIVFRGQDGGATITALTLDMSEGGTALFKGNISGSSVSSSGDILADGDVVAYNSSDMRLKNNLQVIEGALDKIDGINGYEFDWNDKSPGWARQRGHDVGVVAQEVQKIHPEIVEERKNGYLGVDYKRLVPLLIQSVKELKQEIDEIKQKCDCLNK